MIGMGRSPLLKVLSCAVIIAMFSGCALAIGIGPPRASLDFTPNLAADLNFMVVNTISQPIEAMLYVKGDLAQYITLDKASVTLQPGEQQTFAAHVRLPESIEPGVHDIRIGAVEAEAGSGGTVGARAGVESVLTITAPFAGKLIRVVASAANVTFGNAARLRFEVTSIGNETIDALQVLSSVFDSAGNAKAGLSSEQRRLQPGETAVIELSWTPETKGSYVARSRVLYDGNEQQVNLSFAVGESSMRILEINASPFTPGQIVKVSVAVENEWNERLSGVYARVTIIDDGTEVAVADSRSTDLGPFATAALDAFVETTSLDNKEYAGLAVVYFADKSVEQSFALAPASLAQASAGALSIEIVLIVVALAAALVIAVVLWPRKR